MSFLRQHSKSQNFIHIQRMIIPFMALDISEDLTLIRVDLPDKGLVPPLCYRIYITYNPLKDEAHYYTIEMTKEKDVRLLGGVNRGCKTRQLWKCTGGGRRTSGDHESRKKSWGTDKLI